MEVKRNFNGTSTPDMWGRSSHYVKTVASNAQIAPRMPQCLQTNRRRQAWRVDQTLMLPHPHTRAGNPDICGDNVYKPTDGAKHGGQT